MRLPRLLLTASVAACCLVTPAAASHAVTASAAPSAVADWWGADTESMLGDAGATWNEHALRPVQIALPPSVRLTQISASSDDVLALTTTGTVYAWGWNGYGQLGDGTTSSAMGTPARVHFAAGIDVTEVSAGETNSLAVTSTGTVYSWGNNNSGMSGQNPDIPLLTTPRIITDAPPTTAVAAGANTGYLLSTSHNVYAFGANNEGSLGTGSQPFETSVPTELSFPGGASIAAISGGEDNGFAVSTTGQAFAWGSNSDGLLGNGEFGDESTVPIAVTVPGNPVITAISCGLADHVLALTSTGAIYSWGHNTGGELGDGTVSFAGSPVLVTAPAGATFTAISAGEQASLALTDTDRVYAWGHGQYGQIGDGTTTDHTTPTEVTMPQGALAYGVAAGYSTSFALVTPEPPLAIKPVINGLARAGDRLACAPSRPIPVGSVATWSWTTGHQQVAATQGYRLHSRDVGHTLTCDLRLNDGYGTTQATSTAVAPIWQTTLIATKRPALSGTHTVGGIEAVSRGAWTPRPTAWHYQWYADTTPIRHATKRRLTIPKRLSGATLTCKIRATHRDDNSGTATTKPLKIGR